MKVRDFLNENISEKVQQLTKEKVDFEVSIPDRGENGDYSTNIALKLASILKKKPLDIAYDLKGKLEGIHEVIDRVEVAPPGFINFFLSEKYLLDSLDYIKEKGERFGFTHRLENQKVMIEFTDPNPFKEFHIGHLYSNIVGESIARLFETQRAKVTRACYQGDVGLHVAKAIYGMQEMVADLPKDDSPLSVRAQFMGKAYSKGAADYEAIVTAKKSINNLNKVIYERSDQKINELYDKGKKWSLEYFDSIYKRLGTSFDHFYFESNAGKIGLDLVNEFLKNEIFEESEGAVIFPGKKYGLHNRVFINSLGLPTYEAKELGLAPTKYKDFPYDSSIIITGHEVDEYFRVVLKALELINPEIAQKTRHISHGMVRLPGGKMSSRTGEIITGEWLMDEAVARIRREYPEMDEGTAEKVGLAAIKYALLKGSVGSDIEFNFDESIALTGASGPYLQYTYVRTKSLLEKAKVGKLEANKKDKKPEINDEEVAVLRQLVHFLDIVSEAQEKLAPNIIAEYLFDLSQKFNLFYQKHKIADNRLRIQITSAVGQTLSNGLNLLGIECPERM